MSRPAPLAGILALALAWVSAGAGLRAEGPGFNPDKASLARIARVDKARAGLFGGVRQVIPYCPGVQILGDRLVVPVFMTAATFHGLERVPTGCFLRAIVVEPGQAARTLFTVGVPPSEAGHADGLDTAHLWKLWDQAMAERGLPPGPHRPVYAPEVDPREQHLSPEIDDRQFDRNGSYQAIQTADGSDLGGVGLVIDRSNPDLGLVQWWEKKGAQLVLKESIPTNNLRGRGAQVERAILDPARNGVAALLRTGDYLSLVGFPWDSDPVWGARWTGWAESFAKLDGMHFSVMEMNPLLDFRILGDGRILALFGWLGAGKRTLLLEDAPGGAWRVIHAELGKIYADAAPHEDVLFQIGDGFFISTWNSGIMRVDLAKGEADLAFARQFGQDINDLPHELGCCFLGRIPHDRLLFMVGWSNLVVTDDHGRVLNVWPV